MIQLYARLESPTDMLVLDALDGWGILGLDMGDPDTRVSTQNAPDADGTLDFTSFVGARPITLALELVEFSQSLWQMVSRLKSFTRPRVELRMCVQWSETSPLVCADIRRSTWSNPLDNLWVQRPVISWVCPKGVWEEVTATISLIFPASGGTELGRNYSSAGTPQGLTFDRVYPTSPVLGSGSVTNMGNSEAFPVLRVYGPCTDPVIWNDTLDKQLAFSSLSIAAGEFLEIDTRYKTIRYLGDPTDSRYNNLNFTLSRWWTLSPGTSAIRFLPATSSAGSVLEITHYNTYL